MKHAWQLIFPIVMLTFNTFAWAQQSKLLIEMRPSEAVIKLQSIGEAKAANDIAAKARESGQNFGLRGFSFKDKKVDCWKHSNQVLGYIQTSQTVSTEPIALSDATNIQPDASLKNQPIKITLDRLRVFCFPGGGVHNILFDFYGQHQVAGASEDIHFSQTYTALEGEGASVAGYPIFIGLKLDSEGLRMRANTINVSNADDQKLLSFMGSETFTNGLKLINATNPLTPVVTKFASGIVDSIGKRNENITVQKIDLGMDFSPISTRPKLREGSYIAIQTEIQNWDWTAWKLYPQSGQILSADEKKLPIPFNYIIFSISKTQQ